MFWLMGVRSVNFSIKTGVGEPQSFFLVEVARQTTTATNTPSPPPSLELDNFWFRLSSLHG